MSNIWPIEPNTEDDGTVAFKCVVVNDDSGQYAVYVGPTGWSDEKVRFSGGKMNSKAGETLAQELPFLAHQFYSRVYRK